MNIRFEGNVIRFRVLEKEFDALLADAAMSASTTLPDGHIFTYEVMLTDQKQARMTYTTHKIILFLPRSEVEAYQKTFPSKEVISGADGVVKYIFEVDLHSRKRKS